jgi:hypothetical protein
LKPHPADFIATFRFKTTGGDVYKSVGLSFDARQDVDARSVYLSATGKLAYFDRAAGKDVYPPNASFDTPVALGREYELKVAVRGPLVNVSLDGRLVLTHRLQGERLREGRFGLWTYDATAEFLKVEVEELPAAYALYEEPGDAAVPVTAADLAAAVEQAALQRDVAQKTLAAAQAAVVSLQARIEADRAVYNVPPAADAKEKSLSAGAAERTHALFLADQRLAEAMHKLAAARQAKEPRDEKAKKAITDAEAALAPLQKALAEAAQALGVPNENYTRLTAIYPATSSGRRLALARWVSDPRNPLTARVAVNHIWLRHFGSALVPTVFDFGLNGRPPTHPALLDWLAATLVDDGFRMKRLHRLMVTSNTYRQQSAAAANPQARQLDPDNHLLWRANIKRMEAEIVRDSTLHAGGRLDTAMGGPELDQNSGMTVPRRSVYFRNSKEKKMTFLDLFDRPNVVECYRRSESIVPQQALAMANSPLSLMQARLLARALFDEAATADETLRAGRFITMAFEQILSRPPNAAELAECERFLTEQAERLKDSTKLTGFGAGEANPVKPAEDPAARARENLVHVIFNHNDFVTIR